MFKLLSKEIKIFSIPIYVGVLFLMIAGFNVLYFNKMHLFSGLFSFSGIALGYFLFNKIGLNYRTHLPFFIYTFLVFAFYRNNIDIGIAVNLFTNALILFILTTREEVFKKNYYLLVGALLAIGYLFLPTTWATIVFVVLHLLATSDRIGLNFFRLGFGFLLILISYLECMYILGHHSFNPQYIPFFPEHLRTDFYPLYLLIPVLGLILYGILNHFQFYNKKSPRSRFRYTFILLYTITQMFTIVLYMGDNYEYLLFLALPASIIISRTLRFIPKYAVQEIGLMVLIITLILFKIGKVIEIQNITL
ncbi:DUF6427 family protein [Riemerella columbina]|uniref:DUF6427 family protein n=1 Tax=Riemerella columbina TaxID=103810 RepID=UPI000371C959|nr:DUF6427 family protein [Riemerella columbina]